MKTVTGTDRKLSSAPDEWDDDDCLCQGPIPDDRAVMFQQHLYSEKLKKRRWRNVLKCHMDCPIHGVTITTEDRPCREG